MTHLLIHRGIVGKQYKENLLKSFKQSFKKGYGVETDIHATKDNDFNDIRFSVATMDALDCHPEDMEKVYKAHHRFGNLLHDDRFKIKFRLEPGDIF